MCGRYVLASPAAAIADHFRVDAVPEFRPSWNIAPTRHVPVIRARADGTRECVLLRWGFIPAWAKSPTAIPMLNNARAESLAIKPAFRAAWKARRCIVPADGYYEWDEKVQPRQPYYFSRPDGGLLALAGLWETWRSPDGELIDSFAVVTREANAATLAIHDRMPKLLEPDEQQRWLFEPDPADLLAAPVRLPLGSRPVGLRINSVRNDTAENLAPLAATAPAQGQLF